MHLQAQTEGELEVIRRIATVLVALACLADRAAYAPHPVRAFVLWLLRRAETVIVERIAGQVSAVAIRVDSDPADALDLAFALLALAHAVGDLAEQYEHFGRCWWRDEEAPDDVERLAVGRRRRDARSSRRSSRVDLAAEPCPDTS